MFNSIIKVQTVMGLKIVLVLMYVQTEQKTTKQILNFVNIICKSGVSKYEYQVFNHILQKNLLVRKGDIYTLSEQGYKYLQVANELISTLKFFEIA